MTPILRIGLAVAALAAASMTSRFADSNAPSASFALSAPAGGLSLVPDGPLVALNGSLGARVILAAPAPAGGTTVTLGSLAPAIATITPATIVVPAGSTMSAPGAITIHGIAAGPATLTADTPGCPQATAPVTTTTQYISLGTGLAVVPGQTAGLAVSLSIPAPAGGVTINFASSNPAVLTVQPSIFIPFGQQIPAANPQVTGVSLGTANVLASATSFAPDSRQVTVAANVISFAPAPLAVAAGLSSNLEVRIQVSAPPGGQPVFLTTDAGSIATVAPSVTIPAGANSAVVAVNGIMQGQTVLHANAAGMPQADLTVNVIVPVISVNPATIGDDLQTPLGGSLSAPAPPGNLVVTLTSPDPARLLLSNDPAVAGTQSIFVTVPAGTATLPAFHVHALDDTGTVVLAATAPGYTAGSAIMTLRPSGFAISAPGAISTAVAATPSTVAIRPYRLDGGTLALSTSQALRGGINVQVPVATSDPFIGTITVSPAAFSGGQSVVITAFTPVGGGTAFVSVATPSGFDTPASGTSIVANVAPQAISIAGATIGDDLQVASFGSLSAPAPAGNLLVTLASADPSKLLLSASATAAGAPSIVLNVSAGSSSLPAWHAQALDDNGSVVVTATAPGYGPGLATFDLAPSGFVIWTPASISISTGAPAATVQLRPVRLDAATMAPLTNQALRPPLLVNVDVLSANPAIGTISSSPVSFTGNELVDNTGFNPVASGSTVVSVVTPAGFDTPSTGTSIPAMVSDQSITLNGGSIGDDLQVSSFGSLSAPAPAGNLLVTLASADPSRLLLATSATMPGLPSITLMVPAGSTQLGTFWAQALDDTGSVDVTASATGYANGIANFVLGPSGFIVWTPSAISTSTFSAPTAVQIRPVRLAAGTLAPGTNQALRAGYSASVGLTSSNTNVGTIAASPILVNGADLFVNGAFVPLTAGSSFVAIQQPPGFDTPSTSTQIAAGVSAPRIFFPNADVGRDLQVPRTITLESAPPNPLTMTVTSSDPSVATVSIDPAAAGSASLSLPGIAATTAGTVQVQGRAYGSTTIVASAPGYTDGVCVVTVTPAGFIVWTPSTLTTTVSSPPSTVQLRPVRLDPLTLNPGSNQALRGGLSATVPVSSSRPNVGTATVNPIPFGPNALFANTAFQPLQGGTTVISLGAAGPGFSLPSGSVTLPVTVRSPTITMADAQVGEDLQVTRAIALEVAPPVPVPLVAEVDDPSIVTVSLSPGDPGSFRAMFPAVATANPGNLHLHGRHVGSTRVVVSARGYESAKATVTVLPSGMIIFTPASIATTTFSAPSTVQVRPVMLDAVTLNSGAAQAIRGGLEVLVGVTSSLPAVGTISSSPLRLGPGDIFASTSFQPLGAGASTISVVTPPGFDTSSNNRQITATVTAPAISVSAATVGRDLQVARFLSLAAAPPAAVTLTVNVANPAIATVSSTAIAAGGGTALLPGVTTTSAGNVWVQGRALGTTTLSVSAPGYQTGTATITVTPSGFQIFSPGSITTTSASPPTSVQIRPASLDPVTLNVTAAQEVRGGLTVLVPITSANPAIGTITTSPLSFGPGAAFLSTSFQPVSPGATTLNLGTPSGFSTPSNLQQIPVTVNP